MSGGNPLKDLLEAWLQVTILCTNTIAKFVRHCLKVPHNPMVVKGQFNMTCCVHALRRIILRTLLPNRTTSVYDVKLAWLQVGILCTNTIAKFVRHCLKVPHNPMVVKGHSI